MRTAVMSTKAIASASSTTPRVPGAAACVLDRRAHGVGVGEEQPGLDAQHRNAGDGAVLGMTVAVGVLGDAAVSTRPSSATCGFDDRYSSSSSDTMMPMTSPGSVSNSSTPSIAATAAMKSGRAAGAVDAPEPPRVQGVEAAQRADVDELDDGGDDDGGEGRLGQVLEQARSGTAA